MIVVDTNVISELSRARPDPRVIGWLDGVDVELLVTTTVTVDELLSGVECLPPGRRAEGLRAEAKAVIGEDFAGRVISFDLAAARESAEIRARRRAVGRPIHLADAQIAGICRSYQATLLTRNAKDFKGVAGLVLESAGDRKPAV